MKELLDMIIFVLALVGAMALVERLSKE